MRSLFGALKRAFQGFVRFAFNPIRTSELVLCCASTWWAVAMLTPHPTKFSALEIVVANNEPLLVVLLLTCLLMWANFFRKIDRVRWVILILTVSWWVFTSSLVVLSNPGAASLGPYVGMVWLAIFNTIEDSKERMVGK